MREDVTRALAEFALGTAPLPGPAVRQAQRAFGNYLGCALGGASDAAARHATAHADAFSGPRTATVIGQRVRLDPLHAALVNCLQSSIQTFDDTHLSSVIHPTGPVAAALVALLEHRAAGACDGHEFLTGLAVGIEVACRAAVVLTSAPARPHVGLFTTGLVGGLGAAAACSRLLGLDVQRTCWALGTASAQAGGLRSSHMTLAGGLVPALAARAGLEAALLAAEGFDGPVDGLEHRNGLFAVHGPGSNPSLALEGLGHRFELLDLAYKPYPCGIVIHPAIDACLELAPRLAGQAIDSVVLHLHRLALQLTGIRHPADALGCNASVYHWAAAALVRGRAGLPEASQEALHEPGIASLRDRIHAEADPGLARDQACVRVTLADGAVLHARIEHARGSRDRPMSDDDLRRKIAALASPAIGDAQAGDLLQACDSLARARSGWLPRLLAAAVPSAATVRNPGHAPA